MPLKHATALAAVMPGTISNSIFSFESASNSCEILLNIEASTFLILTTFLPCLALLTNYLLILSWHIGEELMKIMRRLGSKGKFIMPLPEPKIIN
jgi:hypothetical protein